MSRNYKSHSVKVKFDSNSEKIKAITFTLNHLLEADYTCNTGSDFDDMFDDLVNERIRLMRKNDKAFNLRRQ